MSDRESSQLTHEELRAILRAGDPAADGEEPGASEIAAMRRAVVAEARRAAEVRPSSWLRPAWALPAAAAVVAAAALWLAIQPGTGPRPATPRETMPQAGLAPTVPQAGEAASQSVTGDAGRNPLADEIEADEIEAADPIAAADTIAAADETAIRGEPAEAGAPGREAAAQTDTAAAPDAMTDTPVVTAPATSLATGRARQERVVHFTAPGGTRVVWKLDPDFDPPPVPSRRRRQGEELR